MMNRKFLAVLLACLFLSACEWDGTSTYNTFDYNLQGTWESNDPSVFSGTLKIETDRITITGYGENQTPAGEDDSKRPFRGFTKGTDLKGYSEEGHIFIEDAGLWQAGLPYTYYTVGSYPQEKFLRFTFGSRVETLQKR
jgi:hypothetical protein